MDILRQLRNTIAAEILQKSEISTFLMEYASAIASHKNEVQIPNSGI